MAESDNAHRYAVYLWDRGYTTALHPAASPAAFAAGHPTVQEHDIAVGPLAHVLSTGANLHTVTAAEHDVTVGPPAHPHAKSTHRAAPHAPAPNRPPRLPPRTSAFNKGAQTPTAQSMDSSLYYLDRPCPTSLQHSVTPGNYLPAMAAPSSVQDTTQH